MRDTKPKISRLGERAILLQWQMDITPENLFWLLSVREKIAQNIIQSKVQVNNTYNSLLIRYDRSIGFIYDDLEVLKSFNFNAVGIEGFKSRLIQIPVCYDTGFGLDLQQLSNKNGLTIPEIIELHTAPVYTVYFLGFLPGFPYLGGMDERLKISRKIEPRKSVLKGAVGIAENQTGIYPKSSPAGWQIIGNCPVDLFDPKTENPSLLRAGDRIKFYAVSKEEHAQITHRVKEGNFQLKVEDYE